MESILQANSIRTFVSYWNESQPCYRIASVRVCICLVAIFSIVTNAGDWISLFTSSSGTPQLDSDSTVILLGDSGFFRLSPLYWFESAVVWWIVIGLSCASLLAQTIGIGGRAVATSSALFWLSLVNRICVVQSLGDILLTMGLCYLVIDSGKIKSLFQPSLFDTLGIDSSRKRYSERRSTVSIALRLCQSSLAVWMLACFCSHLAGIIWWNGEAAWFTAAAGMSILDAQTLSDDYWIGAMLSHIAVLSCGIAAIGFLTSRYRYLSILASSLYWLSIFILTRDGVYALAGVAMTVSFIGKRQPDAASNN